MTGLEELLTLQQRAFVQGFVVFLRVGVTVALLPAIGEQVVPVRVKLAVALAFTLVVAPALGPALPDTLSLDLLARLIATETLAGLLLGLAIRLLVLALQTAGSIAAQSTSLSQILGNASAEPLPAMGHLLVMGGLALAMLAGLHLRAAELLVRSYDILPLGRFPGGAAVAEWGTGRVARSFALAFTLAAPFVILSVLYNLMLGVINRAMPQLMVAFVGAPLITFGGVALLFLMAPLMLEAWLRALNGVLADPLGPGP